MTSEKNKQFVRNWQWLVCNGWFYLLELLEEKLIFRSWEAVGFEIPKCVWCGGGADCMLWLQCSVCNSILIHVQLRFWMPSAARNICFPLSRAITWWSESYRGAFRCYLCCRHWYVACISHFSHTALCWFTCGGGVSDYWLLAPAALLSTHMPDLSHISVSNHHTHKHKDFSMWAQTQSLH